MDKQYVTVAHPAEITYIERKSVFYGYAAHVTSEEEIQAILAQRRALYPDATHHVYGYTMRDGAAARYSDDGEPQGTAGMPVLEAVRRAGVDDTLCVVTRYFGGILLGAGGLVRAYAHAAHEAVLAAHVVAFSVYREMKLQCSYSDLGKYQAALPRYGAIIDGTEYTDRVTLSFAVLENTVPDVQNLVREISAGQNTVILGATRFDYERTETPPQ